MRSILAFAIALVVAASATATAPAPSGTDTPSQKTPVTESLGNRLLDDLPSGIFSPTAPQQPAAPPLTTPDKNNPAPQHSQSKQPAAPDAAGEDVGQPSGALPLVRARQQMQLATALLAKQTTAARAGEPQQQVVAQLDELIAALSKQCQGGQCKPSDQPPPPSQRSQPKPGKPGAMKSGRGTAAARDSSDRLDRDRAQPAQKGDVDEIVKNLWGQLPERSREQMLQSFSDEFLPQYELEIEQYYRKLSEERQDALPAHK